MGRNFIFGYGSLLEKESRERTTGQVEVYPLSIKGLLRGWWARIPVAGLSTTFLGCIQSSESNAVNGLVFEIRGDGLKKLDKREKGYDRIEVSHSNIKRDYANILTEEDKVWTYVNHTHNISEFIQSNEPNKDFPIVQSYVDMCVNGCLEVEEQFKIENNEFLIEFIQKTVNWNKFWVNDRIYPRRPFIYRANAYLIDELLQKHLIEPDLFNQIYFE